MLRKIGLRCIHSFMVNHSFHLRSIDHCHQYFLYLQYLDLWGHTVINLFARDAFAQSFCSNYSVFWNVLYGGTTLCDICICITCLFVLSFSSQPTQCWPNYTLTGQAKSYMYKRLTSTCEYSFYRNWISNETMAVDNISWAISTQECCRRRGWTRIILITWWTCIQLSQRGRFVQSTLVISNSKGLTETLRDIRTSTYQSWESE